MNALRRSVLIALLLSPTAVQAATLSAQEAPGHAGENATVCGTVASAHYAPGSRGRPTFLNLDRPYPGQIFAGVVWGEDRAKFGELESLQGKRV